MLPTAGTHVSLQPPGLSPGLPTVPTWAQEPQHLLGHGGWATWEPEADGQGAGEHAVPVR